MLLSVPLLVKIEGGIPDINSPKFCVQTRLLYKFCVVYLMNVSNSCYETLSYWIVMNNKRGSAAARLLRLRVRIPPWAWMSVCCGCCVLSGRGLCDELITRPEDSYRLWCVVVRDLETS